MRRAVFLLLLLVSYHSSFTQSPTCSITGPSVVCEGDVSVYHIDVQNAVDYTVQWNFPNNTLMGFDNEMAAPHWDAVGTITAIANVVPSGGGAALTSCTYAIEVVPQPDPTITPEYLPSGICQTQGRKEIAIEGYCLGSTARFLPFGMGGSYDWTVEGSNSYMVDNTGALLVTMDAPGLFKVCLEETSAPGCSKKVCATYSVFEPPIVSITELSHGNATAITVCKGEDLLFEGHYEHPDEFKIGSWFWEITAQNSTTVLATGSDVMFNHTFAFSGVYEVHLYATNCLGCASEKETLIITVLEAPKPEIICPSVVCQSDAVIQYCTPSVCTSYNWSIQGGVIQGSSTEDCVNVVWNTPLPDGYGWVTLDPGNCSGGVCTEPATVEVPVIPILQPIEGPASICNPDALAAYQVPYWPGAIYTWSIAIEENLSGGSITTGENNMPNARNYILTNFYGTFRVSVQIEHPVTGCSVSTEQTVVVRNFEIAGNEAICVGEDLTLTVSPTPSPLPYSVEWNVIGTTFVEKIENDPSITIPGDVFQTDGLFFINAVINFDGQDAFDCDALTYAVTVKPKPESVTEIIGPRNICVNQVYTYAANPVNPGTLDWTMSNGSVPATGTGGSVNIVWEDSHLSPFSISITRTVEGCVSDPYVVDNIVATEPGDLYIIGPETVCEDAVSTYTADVDGGSSYNWVLSPEIAGSIISGQGTAEISIQWYQKNYPETPKIILYSTVCETSLSTKLNVNVTSNDVSIPCPNNTLNGCRVCANNPVTFTTYNGGGQSYTWLTDDIVVYENSVNTFTTTFSEPGTHFVRVRMTGPVDCPGVFENILKIDVSPNPDPILTVDNSFPCKNPELVNVISTSYSGASSETFNWSWDGEDALHPFTPPVYTISGGQLTIDGDSFDEDYSGVFSVDVTRTISDLTCVASADIILDCIDDVNAPQPVTGIEFTDWEFNLGQPCTNCRSASPNACGYVTVHGNLLGREFSEVDNADWRVSDPNNGLNPDPNIYDIGDELGLSSYPISVFSKAGYYPSSLRVKFLDESSSQYDKRVIQIPIQPGFTWNYSCGQEPGYFDLNLLDISERVPGVAISGRDWDISVLGGENVLLENQSAPNWIQTVPAGSSVKVCITPYALTTGTDNPGLEYFCTFCDTIEIPAQPAIEITADRENVCAGALTHFGVTNIDPDNIVSYTWTFWDGSTSGLPNPAKSYDSPGTYFVYLDIVTNTGCTLSTSKEIVIQSQNTLQGEVMAMSNDPCGSSVVLMFHSTGSIPAELFLWNTGETSEAIAAMTTGVYSVTATSGIGCTLVATYELEFNPPFLGPIEGDKLICQGTETELSFKKGSGYTYEWETDLPFFTISGDNKLIIPSNVPAQTYSVRVIAKIDERECTSIDEHVIVMPLPPIPNPEVDYTCEPFTAHISTDPVQSVSWTYVPGNSFVAYNSAINAGPSGLYELVATNIYGCTSSALINAEGPFHLDILSGCYSICDTLLKEGTICLPVPDGNYSRWEWVLNESTTLLDGSGPVEPLCLTGDMEGKIVLRVNKDYENDNSEDVTCEDISDPFCLEVLDCGGVECPTTTFQNPLSTLQCVLGGDDFDEQVAMLSDIDIPYPPGYTYCTIPPVIKITSGGYFTNLVTQVYASKIKIVSGYLHITDPVAYGNGLPGYVLLCDEVTHDTCPVTFQLDGDRCNEPIWCMLMPSQPTVSTYWVGSVQTTSATFSIPLHFVTGPECDLSSDTIRLYSYPDYDLLAQTICSATPNPSVDAMCTISFAMATEKFNNLDCVHFEIQSNCKLNCSIDYCFSALPRPAQSRGMNVEEYFSSLDLVPNPASNMLSIKYVMTEGQQGNTGIEICNVLGQTIFRRYDSAAQGNLQIDVSEWRAGLYFVNLVAGNKKVAVKKLVKE